MGTFEVRAIKALSKYHFDFLESRAQMMLKLKVLIITRCYLYTRVPTKPDAGSGPIFLRQACPASPTLMMPSPWAAMAPNFPNVKHYQNGCLFVIVRIDPPKEKVHVCVLVSGLNFDDQESQLSTSRHH